MITGTFKGLIYVGHQKGIFEGNSYNSVTVSNGIEKIKLRNKVDSELLNTLEPESSKVNITVQLRGIKESPQLTLVSIELAK